MTLMASATYDGDKTHAGDDDVSYVHIDVYRHIISTDTTVIMFQFKSLFKIRFRRSLICQRLL